MTMAAAGEFDYFGTNWRSSDGNNQLLPMAVNEASNSSSKDSNPPTVTTPTPIPTTTTAATASTPATPSPVAIISTSTPSTPSPVPNISGSTPNPFSIISASSTGSQSSTRSSTSLDRERRVSHPKSSSSGSAGEHSVKGGKTAKRGKVSNHKLRVLTFSDVENGLASCFSSSMPGWSDSLSELSPDRILSMSDHHETSYPWDENGGGAGKRTKISHPSSQAMSSWDIDGGLAADFDGSLSGLGTELGTASYNMSEALLALPVFKQENIENGYQYILGAATSPAVKMNEETLTYLNQGQSYEIKVKKLGDLSEFHGKCLRSVVRVQFHERRLQYMEKEQMDQWRQSRPGERILDVDIPLSYGVVDVILDTSKINQADFVWDPTKETGLYFKVHAISTEFTAKKHGGEKGVPFRIQIETYSHNDGEGKLLHAASCQIKVFKPKGADRKHKTDREKMEKRSEAEKEKYQPSYECTVLTEVPLEQVVQNCFGMKGASSSLATSFSELTCSPGTAAGAAPLPSSTPTPQSTTPSRQIPPHSSTTPTPPPPAQPHPTPPHHPHSPLQQQQQQQHLVAGGAASAAGDSKSFVGPLSPEATAAEVQGWLTFHRFANYTRVFEHFSGADLLRLNRDDLIQICGVADGIRLNNALQSKSVRPRLTIFICQEPESVYHAIYLECVSVPELKCKLASLFGIQASHIGDIFMIGPSAIHILVTDEVLLNTHDQSRFVVEGTKEETGDKYRILLRSMH